MKVFVLQEDNGFEGLGHCHGVFSSRAKAGAYRRKLSGYNSAEIFEIDLNPIFIPKTKFPERPLPYVKTGVVADALYTHYPKYYLTDLLTTPVPYSDTYSWEINRTN